MSAGTASCDSSNIVRSYLKGTSASKSFAVCTNRVPQVVQEEMLKQYTERQLELSTEQGCHVGYTGSRPTIIAGQGPRRTTWRSHRSRQNESSST